MMTAFAVVGVIIGVIAAILAPLGGWWFFAKLLGIGMVGGAVLSEHGKALAEREQASRSVDEAH
jgi:hypothetical protein